MFRNHNNRMDTLVRKEVLTILRKGTADPSRYWRITAGTGEVERSAVLLLEEAGYLSTSSKRVTLAGTDYYRRETSNRVLTWLRSQWFAVIIAVCTIAVAVWSKIG